MTNQPVDLRQTLTVKKSRHNTRGRRKRQGKRAGARRKRLKYVRLGIKNIRIIYWNCASVKQRGLILDNLVYMSDIFAIQETRLGDGLLHVTGFNCFYNRRHLGMAILVRDTIVASELDMSQWDSDEMQLQAIKVQSENPFVLVNVYACNASVDSIGWQKFSEFFVHGKNVIICGDFNAKGKSWGNISSNTQGEELENALETMDLVCINSGCVTRLASRLGDEDSAIDLTLVSPPLFTVCRWNVLGHYGSDHHPCSILVDKFGISRNHKPKLQSFKYNSTGQDVVSKIRRDKRKIHNHRRKSWIQPPWWNDEVERAWVDKRGAVKKWQNAKKNRISLPDHIRLLKEDMDKKMCSFKGLARTVKSEKWTQFCQSVSADKSLKLFWRLHRSMNNTVKKRCVPDFQSADSTWQRTDESKGRALFAYYLEQSDQTDMEGRITAKAIISERRKMHIMTKDDLVSADEIKAALRWAKNSAPGPDGIRYEDIGKLSDVELEELTKVYNNSIKNATIAEEWLHSYLIPLPKPGRDQSKIQSYRIITMQNTIGKLLEKVIARKISCQLENLHLLPPTLGGYRLNRETWSNAAVFAHDVYEGFHSGFETVAAAIDLEDAYNRVPLDFLFRQLSELKISPVILNWIYAALFQRKVVFKCGSWASAPTIIHPGLPQGSPLSPILFNAYTVRVTANQIAGRGRTLSYADDILVYRQGRDREQIAGELQTELDRLSGWCIEAGALVNPTKAAVTWFSLNNRIVNTATPNVIMCSDGVPRSNTMKYLGVQFDRSLAFNKHVDHVIMKARRGIAAMRVMAAANCEQRHLFLLYQGLVLSVIEYALAILTLSHTQFERLERLQNEAMRIVLGCTRDTACRAMRYLLDIPTMEGRTRICRARAYLRISADKLHPLYSEIRKQKGARLKRGKSWMGLTEDIIQQVCSIDEIDTGAEWLVLTAECDASISVCIKLSRECRQQNPVAVEAEVQALIFENSPEAEAVIYTDGSVVRHTRSSWAFTAQVKGKTKMEDSGAFSVTTSSLTMEVMAVTKAMAWLETQTFTDVCFLSDSMSMLRKIEKGWFRRQWLESLARSKLTKICFIFVPGHAGVRGNERADFLAGGAAMESGRSMDRSDILHAIREDSRENDSSKDIESVSMTRLYEHQVGRGVAREERFSGSQRRIVNQHRTGVVSRFTLRDILKRRSEHLWTEQFDVQ